MNERAVPTRRNALRLSEFVMSLNQRPCDTLTVGGLTFQFVSRGSAVPTVPGAVPVVISKKVADTRRNLVRALARRGVADVKVVRADRRWPLKRLKGRKCSGCRRLARWKIRSWDRVTTLSCGPLGCRGWKRTMAWV